MAKIEKKLLNAFFTIFNKEKYKNVVNIKTTMNNIPEWDSVSMITLSLAIEEQYGIILTEEERQEFYSIESIQEIVNKITKNKPHHDVMYVSSLMYLIKHSSKDTFNFLVFSDSSLRHGLLPPVKAEPILQSYFGENSTFNNMSVKGEKMGDILIMLETMGGKWKGVICIASSPMIFCTGPEEKYKVIASLDRFPFKHGMTNARVMMKYGYKLDPKYQMKLQNLDFWVKRNTGKSTMEEIKHSKRNKYSIADWSKLPKWEASRFRDHSILDRVYGPSLKDYNKWKNISTDVLIEIIKWGNRHEIPVIMFDLFLHSEVRRHINNYGNIDKDYNTFIKKFSEEYKIPLLPVADIAKITDADHRDPRHLSKGQDRFTKALISLVHKEIRGDS